MKRYTVIAIVVLGIVIIAVAGALVVRNNAKPSDKTPAMDMSKSNSDSTSKAKAGKPVATNAVTIDNFAFSSNNITVKVGTTVTWTNKDSVIHTVTAEQVASYAPSSSTIAPGKTYSFTFTKAGTYHYICTIHPDMKGTVVVTE